MPAHAPISRTISVKPDVWRFWVRESRKAGLSVSAYLRVAVNKMAGEQKDKEAA